MESQGQIAQNETLQTEVKIHEREKLHSVLGSYCKSSDNYRHDDVIQSKSTAKTNRVFKDIDQTQDEMSNILLELYNHQV